MLDALMQGARRRVTTPGWLIRAAAAIAGLAVIAYVACLWTAAGIQDAAQTIGRDAEPSVVLGLQIADTLSDMDASVLADALTDNAAAVGSSARYDEDVRTLAADLVAAARNVTYGDAEANPLRALQVLLVRYEQAVVEARYLGEGDPRITSSRLQWASRINRDMAIPQAQALVDANANELEQRYARYRATSLLRGAVGVLALVALLAALVMVQVWLARRVRRLLNLPLLGATALAALATVWFTAAVLGERSDLRGAKVDAYDSLRVLYQAKMQADELRSATSLWLLDPAMHGVAEAEIQGAERGLFSIDLTATEPAREVRESLGAALQLESQSHPAQALAAQLHAGGSLGVELANITYAMPERIAATDSITALAWVEALVQLTQKRDQAGQRTLDVTEWLSQQPSGGAAAFATLQEAIDRTLTVNQQQFDFQVAASLRTAERVPLVTAMVLLAAGLALGGLWLRLREYR